jgi:hypothetical protein
VFVGAGDIGLCGSPGPELTAKLLDGIPGTVFTLGDNAYNSGTAREYRDCYDRSWGRHKVRTRPVPGNHEYESPGAAPYFEYFGFNAGPAGLGYYSFDLGAWHIVALNSNIAARRNSVQGQWLRADLASSQSRCTIAYWHHPLFTSGPDGATAEMRDFWSILSTPALNSCSPVTITITNGSRLRIRMAVATSRAVSVNSWSGPVAQHHAGSAASIQTAKRG